MLIFPKFKSAEPELRTHNKQQKRLYNDGFSRATLVTLVGLLILNAFASCSVLSRGDGRSDFAFVQLTDGSVAAGKKVSATHREEEIIREFAKDWSVLMLSWKGKDDPGLVAFREKVPTNFFKLSWALAPSIRSAVAQQWMKAFETQKYINSSKHSTVYRLTGEPQITQLRDGEWNVEIYGARILLESESQTEIDPYSMELHIKAVTPQPNPLGDDSSPIEVILSEVQATGLMIFDVKEILQNG